MANGTTRLALSKMKVDNKSAQSENEIMKAITDKKEKGVDQGNFYKFTSNSAKEHNHSK